MPGYREPCGGVVEDAGVPVVADAGTADTSAGDAGVGDAGHDAWTEEVCYSTDPDDWDHTVVDCVVVTDAGVGVDAYWGNVPPTHFVQWDGGGCSMTDLDVFMPSIPLIVLLLACFLWHARRKR